MLPPFIKGLTAAQIPTQVLQRFEKWNSLKGSTPYHHREKKVALKRLLLACQLHDLNFLQLLQITTIS